MRFASKLIYFNERCCALNGNDINGICCNVESTQKIELKKSIRKTYIHMFPWIQIYVHMPSKFIAAGCLSSDEKFFLIFFLLGSEHLLPLPSEQTYVQRPEPPEEEGEYSTETSS